MSALQMVKESVLLKSALQQSRWIESGTVRVGSALFFANFLITN